MNLPTVGLLCAGLLSAGWQSATPPSITGERVETGQIRFDDGRQQSYRIRLLPVSSFPQIPDQVASELERMHCMIPQSFEARQPENVIEGAFRAPGSRDWAALCSVDGTTTLYVFFAGHYDRPESLRSQADTLWLGAEPGSALYGSAWGIAARRPADLRALRSLHGNVEFDHDGIEDAHLEHSVTVHYWQAGQFLALGGHD
jgi:hypothetical protein